MTDNTEGTGTGHGPPWSVDVLADLHAGVLSPKESAALWERVNQDPEAQAVLAALDSLQRDLNDLGSAPVEAMPAQYAAKLDTALATEAATTRPARPGVAPVVNLAEARRKRNRMLAWGGGVLTAAAAAIAVAFVAFPQEQTDGSPVAGDDKNSSQPAPGNEPLELDPNNPSAAIGGLTGEQDYGPLENEQGLTDCLTGLGVDVGEVIGARQVTVGDKEGVAALLTPGEQNHKFRLVIVDPECKGSEPITDASIG